MVRITTILCMLFSFALVAHAADDQKKSQETEKRFDTQLSPAVHVNSTGLENSYGSGSPAGALNRLRSIRETPLLQLTAPTETDAETKTSQGAATNRSSRRLKPANAPTDTPPSIVEEPVEVASVPESSPSKPKLTSVMKRRGQAEPTLAAPPTTASPGTIFNPPGAPPRSAEANSGTGQIIRPLQVFPTPADADFVAELATPVNGAPELASPTKILPHSSQPQPSRVVSPGSIEDSPSQPETPRLANLPAASPRRSERSSNFNVPSLPGESPSGQRPTTQNLPTHGSIPSQPMRSESFNQLAIPTQDLTSPVAPEETKPSPTVRAESINVPTHGPVSGHEIGGESRPSRDVRGAEDELMSNRSPVLVVKTHGPTKIRVGRPATYQITASNKGDLAAEDVVVDVNVPNWAELSRNQSTAGTVRVEPNQQGDNVLHWSIRDLKAGSSQRLRIDLVPRTSRPLELGVTWKLKSVSAMAQIEVEEPKLRMSVVGPSDIRFGDTKLYSITVSNPGTGDAENVMLQLLPMNGGGGTAGERELGTLKAGTQRTVEVELTARQAGDLAIRALALADGGLRAEGNQPVRVRRPNLVVKAVGPKKRYAGTQARYMIRIGNNGDATARDVLAIVELPTGSQFVKTSKNGAYDKNRNAVQWSIGALRPGAQQVVEVIAVVNGSGPSRIDARASAKLDQLTASDSAVTAVEALADLRLTVVDPVGPVALDTEVAYEVVIENRGTKAAKDIDVVGYFSEGIEPVAVKGWQGTVSIGEVRLESIPQVSPGQRLVIKVIAVASREGNHVFRAELASHDPSTKTKLAVEEWTVFHADIEPLDEPIQKADKSDGLFSEPIQR